MPLTHVVHKPFLDEDVKRLPGELVDAMGWRTVTLLEDQHRISTIPDGADPVVTVDGRVFIDRSFIVRYGMQEERPARTVEVTQNGQLARPHEPQQDEPDATPAAARLAAAHEIDLAAVHGSGKNGRIQKSDVQAVIDGG